MFFAICVLFNCTFGLIYYVSHFSRVFCLTNPQMWRGHGVTLKKWTQSSPKVNKNKWTKTTFQNLIEILQYIYSTWTIKVFVKKTLYMLMTLKSVAMSVLLFSNGSETEIVPQGGWNTLYICTLLLFLSAKYSVCLITYFWNFKVLCDALFPVPRQFNSRFFPFPGASVLEPRDDLTFR